MIEPLMECKYVDLPSIENYRSPPTLAATHYNHRTIFHSIPSIDTVSQLSPTAGWEQLWHISRVSSTMPSADPPNAASPVISIPDCEIPATALDGVGFVCAQRLTLSSIRCMDSDSSRAHLGIHRPPLYDTMSKVRRSTTRSIPPRSQTRFVLNRLLSAVLPFDAETFFQRTMPIVPLTGITREWEGIRGDELRLVTLAWYSQKSTHVHPVVGARFGLEIWTGLPDGVGPDWPRAGEHG